MPRVRQVLAFDNVDFGVRVSIGQIYRAALAVQGVEWAEVAWLSTTPTPVGLIQSTDLILFGGRWDADTSTTMADPGTGQCRLNSTTAPTILALSTTTDNGINRLGDFSGLKAGDQILMQDTLAPTSWWLFVVTCVRDAQLGLGADPDRRHAEGRHHPGAWQQRPVHLRLQAAGRSRRSTTSRRPSS